MGDFDLSIVEHPKIELAVKDNRCVCCHRRVALIFVTYPKLKGTPSTPYTFNGEHGAGS